MMEYRKRLDEIICWLTKAENAVQRRSTPELEENLQELTVSGLFVSVFANASWCMNIYTKNKRLHDWRRKGEETLCFVVNSWSLKRNIFF